MTESIAPMIDPADMRGTLLRAGLVPTEQRLAIAQAILCRHQHLSADQLLMMVRQAGHAIAKATVYNTLKAFADAGLVRTVVVDPARVFYDSNTSAHHHLFREDLGELVDLPTSALPVGSPEPGHLPEGIEVAGIDVIIRARASRLP